MFRSSCLIAYVTRTLRFKGRTFHELNPSQEGGYQRWQLMSNWCQFTGVHFPDLNRNSSDLNNMKFDLNVSANKGVARI